METATATTTKWAIDPAHSEIHFKVKHLMISNVTGSFGSFGADATLEGDDLSGASVEFWADLATVNTGSPDRDTHLKSPDFFDAEKFPKLTFRSTDLRAAGRNWKMTGDLMIKGITKPVTLDVEWSGTATDPWGNAKAGLTVTGSFDRKEWGLTWNTALEAGGVLVSDEVRLVAEVQLVKKA